MILDSKCQNYNFMKYYLVPLVFIFQSVILNAQSSLDLGNRIFGGSISVKLNEASQEPPVFTVPTAGEADRKYSNFSISPYYGRFIKNEVLLGIRFNVGQTTTRQQNSYNSIEYNFSTETMEFGFGTFIRRYFPFSEKFGVFFEPGMDFRRSISTYDGTTTDISSTPFLVTRDDEYSEKSNSIMMEANLGIYVFIFPELSLETKLGNLFMRLSQSKIEERDLINNEVEEGSGKSSIMDLDLINQIQLDQLITLNYFF